jgi:hypothetical protein
LDFELLTISNSGYPGYFLIVQDLIAEASMGVSVGPGRGSARDRWWRIENYQYRPIDVQPAFVS